MTHHKHPPIARRTLGNYARVEFSFVGTTCERIDGWLSEWGQTLATEMKVLTVTGDHGTSLPGRKSQHGSKLFETSDRWNDFDDKLLGSQYDLALINGNHYPGAAQIVFIDGKKASTLKRRKDQLTNVFTIVLCPGEKTIPAWLKKHVGEDPIVYQFSEWLKRGLTILRNYAVARLPTVKALILTGGKSTRMGKDKASLVYRNGENEAKRLARICEEKGLKTYFSVSEATGQENEINDRFVDLGPMGAIASAFMADPESAWLVLACDLPLVAEKTVGQLLAQRDPSRLATAIRGASQPFPEPLIALYEPRAYGRLLQFLSIGHACPRKVLINSDVKEIVLEDEAPLTNANTPAERAGVLALLEQGIDGAPPL
ncbi:NTP transferase domain-containing protein [Neolewinella antarctica]|uniref:Molybdopterin-guanine dinucleotide biosynthesis protein A n=1 Tax=Neolewinella antarctica TaxID=442734 RepID=A0ABX0XAM4_9BACT|nr:NTP transferase domain-containing protein [Neolewinella antarctica]NJC26326.1 molybdopterin-guanine dinucleotide biosynthesis protein A [Neolewinella antarctica]